MRKLTILALVAAPLSAFGAYALAADEADKIDTPIVVNDAQKADMAPSVQSAPVAEMETEDEAHEAGPILKTGMKFDDDSDTDYDGDSDKEESDSDG